MIASRMMGRGRRNSGGHGGARVGKTSPAVSLPSATHRAIEAVWRIESAKIIAVVARMLRDVGTAEELAQDVLVTAMEQWPEKGVPDNPAAWLTAAAKNRALDHLRRNQLLERKHQELGVEMEVRQELADADNAEKLERIDEDIDDDLLRLIFTACHPVLSARRRASLLTLKLLGGLTTEEIGRAFLTPETTVAQRIVRAKRTLTEAKVPFELPRGEDRAARLASVLEVVYLIFNEGYAATAGCEWMRPTLCEEALRLGRILAGLMPDEAEVHGLTALMEIQASRAAARIGPKGEPILLFDQNRARWDHLLINRGLGRSWRAPQTLGAYLAPTPSKPPSPPATPAPPWQTPPTGRASPPSTTPWRNSPRHP